MMSTGAGIRAPMPGLPGLGFRVEVFNVGVSLFGDFASCPLSMDQGLLVFWTFHRRHSVT